MKNILLITYDMIPHSRTWGGCQRMYFLTKALREIGHDVTIIALRNAPYNDFGKEFAENTFFPNVRNPYVALESNNQLCPVKRASRKTGRVIMAIKKIAFKFDKLFFNEIKTGDGLLSFKEYITAKAKILEFVSKNNYDVVICSGPPFNVFRCIPQIRRLIPLSKIIMDYRDPWNSWHVGNKLTSAREAKYQNIADRIVCTNQSLCDDLSQRFGTDIKKFSVVANGYVGVSKPCINRLSPICTFVYAGSISFTPNRDGYRDTTQIINALTLLKDSGINNFIFKFVGATGNDDDYLKHIKSNLGEMIEIFPPVSPSDADKFIRESDICLLLHTSNDNSGKFLISGKAYDYIREKKYILSIGDKDGQHASIVNELGIGVHSVNETESILAAIKHCLALWEDGSIVSAYDNLDVDFFSRNQQIQQYIKLIENL